MPVYEVKAWVTVHAEDEKDAFERAANIIGELPEGCRYSISLEGTEAVYEDEDAVESDYTASVTKEAYEVGDVVSVHITWNRVINGKRGVVETVPLPGQEKYCVKLSSPPSPMHGPPDGYVYLFPYEMEPW